MGIETYERKLTDPRWQKKRLEILNRDNWKCQGCGKTTEQLEVHHIDYWGRFEPWEYPNDLLITCCHSCHGSENLRFQHEKGLSAALKATGFLAVDIVALSTLLHDNNNLVRHLKNAIKQRIQGNL